MAAEEFDMTDEQFDQYMSEAEPVTLVDPPAHKPLHLGGNFAPLVIKNSRVEAPGSVFTGVKLSA